MVEVIHYHDMLDFEKPGKSIYEVAFHHDGTWGNVLMPLTVINGTAGAGRSVACFGGTHGDEYEGQVAVWRLMHELDPAEMAGQVILIPRLNVPACAASRRESPMDGVNMNRAFPGDPGGSMTYRIAHFVTSKIFPQVDVVIDIHSAGRGMQFALCTSFHQVKDPKQYEEMKVVAGLFDGKVVSNVRGQTGPRLKTAEKGKLTLADPAQAQAFEGKAFYVYDVGEGDAWRVPVTGYWER